MIDILGLKIDFNPMNEETRNIYSEWEKARKNKDFVLADKLRNELISRGIL
jgi:cysteinyl-tRNA synthetase